MIRKNILAIVPLIMLGATNAEAGFVTGNDLLRFCTSSDPIDFGQCVGYIEGVESVQEFTRQAAKLPACLPNGTELGQIKDATIAFLRDHPAVRGEDGSALVLSAIGSNWNCKS